MSKPSLHSIWIAPEAQAAMQSRATVKAVAGVGLEGDRYARGVGTFSNRRGMNVRELSLIALESVVHLAAASNTEFGPGSARRNLVTEGIDLLPLSAALLRIGDVEIECTSTCPPCGHLDRLLGIDTRVHLRKRGGLRARIVRGGILEPGMAIEVVRIPPPLP